MLTNSENAWLADRKKDRLFVCRFCPGKNYGREMPDTGGVPCVCHCMSLHIKPECYKLHKGTGWDEAAEFSERVAAKLADPFFYEQYPAEIRLMLARLAVEEEMDGYNTM